MGNWLEVWYENYAKIKMRPSTYLTYHGYIENHIKPQLGKISLNDLTTLHLQQFYKKFCIRFTLMNYWKYIIYKMYDSSLSIELYVLNILFSILDSSYGRDRSDFPCNLPHGLVRTR